MPIFIISGLGLCYLVQTESLLLNILVSPVVIYLSLGFALCVITGMFFRKIPDKLAYDFFSVCVLILWFAYWKPEFNNTSPLFFFYPLYFVFMIAFVSLFFISQRDKIDSQSFRYMRIIDKQVLFKPWIIMLCVLGSLELFEHILLFPVLMTLLIIRFALSVVICG